mmetsp:Transcript_21805/g.50225  ORF Transcript_21805/g.50225 Transcript_21805/m.50225 type:complete len:553 (+) Transcript_21805:82-1740(+)
MVVWTMTDGKGGPTINMPNLLRSWYFPALGGFLYGYDIGGTAMVLEDLTSAKYSDTTWYFAMSQSSTLQGVVVAMVTLGAMIGSIAVFRFESALGRRREMLVAAICYTVGGAAQYYMGDDSISEGVAISGMCLARVLYGFGVGFAMHGAPSYIAETAPSTLRGSMVAAKEAMIVIGMLSGYCIGAACQDSVGAWRYVYLAEVPMGLMFGWGVYTLPPSPRWLALKGERVAAESSLKFVMPTLDKSQVEALLGEASDKQEHLEGNKSPSEGSAETNEFSITGAIGELTATRAARAGLKAGLGLVVLQQITGQPSILYYVDTIFNEVGLGNSATIGLAVWKLFCTMIAVRYADDRGRRELLFAGCALMGVALLSLTVVTTGVFGSSGTAYEWCILGSMFVYIGGYQVGFGPVTWTIISEIFPLRQRGKALSFAVFTNFACNTIVSFGADDLLAFSLPFTFALFFLLDVYAVYFVYGNVPETKGLTLEQITMMLERFAEMPMRQPIKTDEGETKGFLPRRDSAAILGAFEDMQGVEVTEEEDNSDYGTSTNTRRS